MLVTALTAAVAEAAVEYTTTQPGGRLAIPMLVVLDEVANACRWTDLPDSYYDCGSRGILDAPERAALPRGRAVMLSCGTPAALIETVPWVTGKHARAVRASIAAHDPAGVPANVRPSTTLPVATIDPDPDGEH